MSFEHVQSICSECGRPVPGVYARDGGAVYLVKTCPEHGETRVLASEDAEAFERWIAFPSVTVPPRVFITKGAATNTVCPLHCGPCENHLMTACCVLLNVTDRCNQHCPYCFAESEMESAAYHGDGTFDRHGNIPAYHGDGTFDRHGNSAPAAERRGENRDEGNIAAYHGDGTFDRHGNIPAYHGDGTFDRHRYIAPPAARGGESRDEAIHQVNENNASGDPARQRASQGARHGGDSSVTDPTIEEIGRRLDRLTELGEERKFNIQLSGGEPTVRGDLPDIIALCKEKGFEYVQLNTNGRKLAEDPGYAKALKAVGLSTVFMQFDGVSDDVYLKMRGEPLFEIKKVAVRNCAAASLPVTLVPTVVKSVNLNQVGAIIDFILENIKVVKGVHFQPASFFGRKPDARNEDGDFDERVTMFAVMDEIEKQTNGRIKKADLAPISTGHPLCCFCAAYMKERDGELRPLSSGGSCCGPESGGDSCGLERDPLEIVRRDRDFVMNKWDAAAADEEPCCCTAVVAKNADAAAESVDNPAAAPIDTGDTPAADIFIARETKGAKEARVESAPLSLDEALAMFKSNMFTISGMAFMDETNLDAERLRRCRVQVFSADERLIPFCAYYSSIKNYK